MLVERILETTEEEEDIEEEFNEESKIIEK